MGIDTVLCESCYREREICSECGNCAGCCQQAECGRLHRVQAGDIVKYEYPTQSTVGMRLKVLEYARRTEEERTRQKPAGARPGYVLLGLEQNGLWEPVMWAGEWEVEKCE